MWADGKEPSIHDGKTERNAPRFFTYPLWSNWAQRTGPGFATAYARSLSQRLPLLYSVVIFDLILLSVRFFNSAPVLLTVIMPLMLGSFASARAVYWLPAFARKRDNAVLVKDLAQMSLMGSVSALIFAFWALSLYAYGDVSQRALVHYIIAITCFSGILGLGQSPLTALRIAFAVMVPATIFIFIQGHPNAVYVSLVQLVVTALLLFITNGYHRDFVRLELSRQQLARRERQAARLARVTVAQANIDPLTGASNRRAILARLERELRDNQGKAGSAHSWLALVDLDGFKHVNDTYGHAAGDAVLKAVAERIEAHAEVIAFGRLGGDEFALILGRGLDVDAASAVAKKLGDSIRLPIAHNGATLRLSASIGLWLTDGLTVSECLERADTALYKAKELGDGALAVFGAADELALRERTAITRQFNDCALDARLKLVYQPILDADAGVVTGFEAFARWSPDGLRWLNPGRFMSLAEATGRTGELTRLVLARALKECRAWEQGRTLAINLAPRDVMRDGMVEALHAIALEAGAPAGAITLEVTERALLGDVRRTTEQLERFRACGFRIALDDFGAGWSSLAHVHRLPLDILKIDQGLARALASDPGARAIAGTIVALSWQLGLECTIEGIEDAGQADTARALGIKSMQGYYFGHPLPADEALAALVEVAHEAEAATGT